MPLAHAAFTRARSTAGRCFAIHARAFSETGTPASAIASIAGNACASCASSPAADASSHAIPCTYSAACEAASAAAFTPGSPAALPASIAALALPYAPAPIALHASFTASRSRSRVATAQCFDPRSHTSW